jgi:hypothetical protein
MNGMLGNLPAARAAGRHRASCVAEPADHQPIAPAEAPAEPVAVSPVLSSARLDELRATLPADTLANLVEECLFDLSERLTLLLAAVQRQDTDQIVAHVHAMAGMAAGAGWTMLETPTARADAGDAGDAGGSWPSGRGVGGRAVPRRHRAARGIPYRNGLSIQAILTRRSDDAAMLSPATLAAFSVGVTQPGFSPTNSVHRARAVGPQAAQPPSPAAPATGTPPLRDGDAAPSRLLPRGSLLDLSV